MTYKPQVLATADGGTGLSAPGTSGNVLTSNGSIWTSAAPSGGSAQSFLAILSADQTNVTGDGTAVQIPFDVVIFDTASGFTTGASAHYTFPNTGKWLITCGICYQPFTTSGNLFLNDLVLTGQSFRQITSLAAAASQFITLGATTVVSVTSGNTFFVNANNTGGTKNTNILGSGGGTVQLTYISGHSIG